MRPVNTQTILSAATATGAGSSFPVAGYIKSFQAYGTTASGSGAVTVDIQVCNNADAETRWITIGTISLTLGTTETTDAFASETPFKYVRAKVTSISGTSASVTVVMGVV